MISTFIEGQKHSLWYHVLIWCPLYVCSDRADLLARCEEVRDCVWQLTGVVAVPRPVLCAQCGGILVPCCLDSHHDIRHLQEDPRCSAETVRCSSFQVSTGDEMRQCHVTYAPRSSMYSLVVEALRLPQRFVIIFYVPSDMVAPVTTELVGAIRHIINDHPQSPGGLSIVVLLRLHV